MMAPFHKAGKAEFKTQEILLLKSVVSVLGCFYMLLPHHYIVLLFPVPDRSEIHYAQAFKPLERETIFGSGIWASANPVELAQSCTKPNSDCARI